MTVRTGSKAAKAGRMLLPLVAGIMAISQPAQAQFSEGYRFLEAIKKKDGQKIDELINQPGTNIVNTRDSVSGETALHLGTARRDVTWMTFLIQRGANVNARDQRGVTPMVLACNMAFVEGVELLVAAKAKVDESNDAGETPLISAVHNRNIALMRLLLKAGADPDRADNSGRSARDYATLGGQGSPLLDEIAASAKPREAKKASAATYGPSFR